MGDLGYNGCALILDQFHHFVQSGNIANIVNGQLTWYALPLLIIYGKSLGDQQA
jgi:hypothetical protein